MATLATNPCDLIDVARRVHVQDLDCDLVSFVFTPPHTGKPAVTQRNILPIVAERDLYGPWKQTMAAACLAQGA